MKKGLFFIFLTCLSYYLQAQKQPLVIVGTYNTDTIPGLYIYQFQPKTGMLNFKSSLNVVNPSFICAHPNKPIVYVVNELATAWESTVSAYLLDTIAGELQLINQVPAMGGAPCYISIAENGRWVFTANYLGGNIAAFPISENGELQSAQQIINFSGNSINQQRQEASHAHMILLNETNDKAYVTNLGNDSVHVFQLNTKTNENPLSYLPSLSFKVAQGSGPRHIAINKQHPIVYVLNELSGNITVWKEVNNSYQLKQTIETAGILASDKGSAHLLLTADNRFLYSSDRNAYNSISVFKVDVQNGELTLLQTIGTKGEKPRHFTIDASGKWLMVGNQNSKSIQLFKRDTQTGKLITTNYAVGIENPACILPLKW